MGFEERVLPGEPVESCREWPEYEPYEYMWPILRDEGHLIANLQMRQTGKPLVNHLQGIHDDRFWALALAVYTAEQASLPPSIPLARTI